MDICHLSTRARNYQCVIVNHLCEAKGEQDGEANKAQECFAEFVIRVAARRPGMQVLTPWAVAVCLRVSYLRELCRQGNVGFVLTGQGNDNRFS